MTIAFSTLISRGKTMLEVIGCPPDSEVIRTAEDIVTLCQLLELQHDPPGFEPRGNVCGLNPSPDERGIAWACSMLNVLRSRCDENETHRELSNRIFRMRNILRNALEAED